MAYVSMDGVIGIGITDREVRKMKQRRTRERLEMYSMSRSNKEPGELVFQSSKYDAKKKAETAANLELPIYLWKRGLDGLWTLIRSFEEEEVA